MSSKMTVVHVHIYRFHEQTLLRLCSYLHSPTTSNRAVSPITPLCPNWTRLLSARLPLVGIAEAPKVVAAPLEDRSGDMLMGKGHLALVGSEKRGTW